MPRALVGRIEHLRCKRPMDQHGGRLVLDRRKAVHETVQVERAVRPRLQAGWAFEEESIEVAASVVIRALPHPERVRPLPVHRVLPKRRVDVLAAPAVDLSTQH